MSFPGIQGKGVWWIQSAGIRAVVRSGARFYTGRLLSCIHPVTELDGHQVVGPVEPGPEESRCLWFEAGSRRRQRARRVSLKRGGGLTHIIVMDQVPVLVVRHFVFAFLNESLIDRITYRCTPWR